MPNMPFDRTTIGYLSKPVSDDHNREASQHSRTLRHVIAMLLAGRASDASEAAASIDNFHGMGFAVTATSPASLGVQITAGLGWHYLPADLASDIGTPDLIGVDDLADLKPLLLMTPQVFATPTAPAGPNTRIDIIEVRADRELVDSETRRQLDTSVPGGVLNPHNFYTTLTYLLDGKVGTVNAPADSTEPVSYKVGVAANPGVAPATTAGYIKIAEILVGSAVATIGTGDIIDRRKLAGTGGSIRVGVRFRNDYNAGAPSYTLRSLISPPSVKVAIGRFSTDRAQARVYVLAGEATEVVLNGALTRYTGTPGTTQAFLVVIGPTLVSGDYIMTVDAGLQTALAAATPPLAVPIGAKVIVFDMEGRYSAAAVDNTNAILEAVEFQAQLDISYQ